MFQEKVIFFTSPSLLKNPHRGLPEFRTSAKLAIDFPQKSSENVATGSEETIMPSKQDLANAIRALSMDSVQKADSGHPGMPMGMADIAIVLWHQFLKHNPCNPKWFNRDRFVLSNGHGSMLLYSLLHLTGYDLSIEDLKQFRQLHSKTPGHPEYGETPGVETTTGPLGQGIAMAVGMAMAEKKLAHDFNQNAFAIIDHFTYVFLGDGCLMEGVSHEACSLAGTYGLGKLIAFWDNNGISIDGKTANWFTDNTPQRFRAYGWQVIEAVDGHDHNAIENAIIAAQADTEKPTLICCHTNIGFGSPNLSGSEKSHGSPLGQDEITLTREQLGWSHPPFVIPENIYDTLNAKERGVAAEEAWHKVFADYRHAHGELATTLMRQMHGELPNDWHAHVDQFISTCNTDSKATATRKSSLACLNHYQPILPELLGGSADLSGSNCTKFKKAIPFGDHSCHGNYIHYGVREFGMSAIMNGLALHGGLIPFGGTFLVFSDYARNAIRLSAMMRQKVIYVYSHDSIGLGEDGPTHQPIEQAASLRLIPNVHVWRPCDATETAAAWKCALQYQGPSCLLLTRQDVMQHHRAKDMLADIQKGAYVLQSAKNAEILIMATGSEVELAVQAANQLNAKGHATMVVSAPCLDIFDQQHFAYRELVLPKHIKKRIAIEAGCRNSWYKYVGDEGHILGIDQFGVSAPYKEAYKVFDFTVEHILSLLDLTIGAKE